MGPRWPSVQVEFDMPDLQNVGVSTSHKPIDFHGLLQEQFYFFALVNLMHRQEKLQRQAMFMRDQIFLYTACPRIIVFSRLQE
jgi:hypothetical protein